LSNSLAGEIHEALEIVLMYTCSFERNTNSIVMSVHVFYLVRYE
jgi:hypothetical protein